MIELRSRIGWGGMWRALDWWGRNQRWWWALVIAIMLAWLSYDVGRMVTRAGLVSLGGPVSGTLTLEDLETRATSMGGGRLIITSSNSARFIDRGGDTWEIPGFGDKMSKEHLKKIKDARVSIDGDIAIDLAPVRTNPRDLVVSTLTDIAMKLGLLSFYGFIIWMLLRSLNKAGERFRRIDKTNRPTTRIASIAGYEGPKREVLEIVEYLRNPEVFKRVGARPPGGVLLYGPPGNGKTQMAKAIAGEADAYFLEQSASSFIQIYAGEGAKAIRALFAEARKHLPCVLFIDEIDAIGSSRSGAGSHDERLQTINALLTEMDGFGDNQGIVVIAATNRLEVLDEALVRPGRFDRKVHMALPGRTDRLAILKVHALALPHMTANLERWADQTQGLSGADLAGLVNEAAIESARANSESVGDPEFSLARDRVLLGARNHGRVQSEAERRTVAVHELGHALMRLHAGGKVEKVSILPRTRSMGVTLSSMDEESVLQTPAVLKQELSVLMGGRAAEKEILGTVTSGAADDMERASNLAREALRRFGWGSEDVPYIPQHESLQKEGEARAAEWVGEAYAQARQVMGENRAALDEAVLRLLEAEELDGSDIQRLLRPLPQVV